MAGWFPGGERDQTLYQEAANCYAPDVPVHFLDGKNPEVVRCCWAAADMFLSLVDNPQETFGLAPVEAMAAGVPLVVSDWDGYRYTVTDGVEGFFNPYVSCRSCHRVRSWPLTTTMACSHIRITLVQWPSMWRSTRRRLALAIARLAEDPLLRQRMGSAGRQTVQQRFDWPVVARLHHQLYAELADRRRYGQGSSDGELQHPLRSDPFRDFGPFHGRNV